MLGRDHRIDETLEDAAVPGRIDRVFARDERFVALDEVLETLAVGGHGGSGGRGMYIID